MTKIEAAARQALEALESCTTEEGPDQLELNAARDTLVALREVLAEQHAAEPVAWSVTWEGVHCGNFFFREQDAKDHKARLDAKHPCEKREVVPLYTHPAPTQQPLTQPEGCKLVPVERSYDMRVQAILHFNTAKKNGADLDDCLEAAWQATLAAAHSDTGSAAPPQQPLTDEQIEKVRDMIDWTVGWSYIEFARAIEAAHGITSKKGGAA